jgi:hypothetical protein
MSVQNPFNTPLVEQIVPGALRMKEKLSHGAVGSGRYNSLFTPITGQSGYSAGGSGTKLMTFKITGADYCDTSTMALSWKVSSATANTTSAIDESILSLVQQITVRVGGVQLYTITDFPCVYNALVSVSMPKEVYNQDGPTQGLYKSSTKFGSTGTAINGGSTGLGSNYKLTTATNGYFDSQVQQQNRLVANSWIQGRYYSIPLGFLFSGFREYFPIRNVSNIEIELLLQSSIDSCIIPSGANGTAQTTKCTGLTIDEAELRVDMVRCSPDLYALMDSEILHGGGVSMTFDLHTNIPFSLNNSSATPGERALQTAQSVRFLKSVYLTTRLTQYLNDPAWSKSNFGCHQFAQYRLLINGMSYPQIPVSKSWDAYNEMKKCQNKLGNLAGDSVAGFTEWLGPYQLAYNFTTADGTVAPVASKNSVAVGSSRDGTWWGSQPLDDARFVLATNLETFLTSRDCDLDGVNLAESAGSLCEVRITNAPASVVYTLGDGTGGSTNGQLVATATAVPVSYNVILHHAGILSIRGGAVEFLK